MKVFTTYHKTKSKIIKVKSKNVKSQKVSITEYENVCLATKMGTA